MKIFSKYYKAIMRDLGLPTFYKAIYIWAYLHGYERYIQCSQLHLNFAIFKAGMRCIDHDFASPNGDTEKYFTDKLSLAGDGFDTGIKAKQAGQSKQWKHNAPVSSPVLTFWL
ncbi:hypothetical protein DVH24_037418 [Malus domestica]|uniref:Uncharacterized protein n=1 Tax=Malus domestica TaxID=3750 RepID=A0A498HH36_MALDO|nr:hypothetical protein DVH24_037418 [Malus domestica]